MPITWKNEKRSISDLIPAKYNPRKLTEKQAKDLSASLKRFDLVAPVIINKNNTIIGGHQRIKVLYQLGVSSVDVRVPAKKLTEKQEKELNLRLNRNLGEWDFDLLGGFDLEFLKDVGFDNNELNKIFPDIFDHGKLKDRFLIPPFTVFDTRRGYWQDRKRLWEDAIQDKGESREGRLRMSHFIQEAFGDRGYSNVSILDPVLAEICSKWFCYEKGNVIDPFAGDTVFGFVSSFLGNKFTGIELREEQATLNNDRCKANGLDARYICDDGQNVAKHIKPKSQDLLFSCPPYFDLEKYSDDPKDASNQAEYSDFLNIIRTAFHGACGCLKDDRFAVIVISNVRAKDGSYYDLVGDFVKIFQEAGLHFYNDIVLINTIGTAALRAARAFKSRKVTKVHQNILVFYKGDMKKIKDRFEDIEYESADLEL